jgi:hypothetical protein
MWSALLAMSLATAASSPPEVPEETRQLVQRWTPRHPVAIGARGAWWAGAYQSGGFGGHVDVRLMRRFGVQLYADVLLRLEPELHRRDHVIGFDLYVPVGKAEAWWIAPTLGACVDFRVLTQPQGGPDARDVRFGVHAGLKGHVALIGGLGLELIGTFTTYVGRDLQIDGWETQASTRFQVEPVGQLTAAITYSF